jgi:signal transduction histidine kinase
LSADLERDEGAPDEGEGCDVVRAVLDATSAAVVLFVDEIVRHVNPAAEALLGAASAVLVGCRIDELCSRASFGDLGRALAPLARTEVTLRSGAVAFVDARALPPLPGSAARVVIVTLHESPLGDLGADPRATQRLIRLQAVTSLLSRAISVAEVGEVVVRYAVEATGSNTGGVLYTVTADGAALELCAHHGTPDLRRLGLGHIAIESPLPAAFAARTRRAVWVETAEDYERLYPTLAASLRPETRANALCVLPLVVSDRVLGVIGMGFTNEHPFAPSERAFMLTLAEQSAQALDRARAYERERTARADAERARRAREELLAVVAHDLKNPLGAIVLAASAMERRADATELGESTRRYAEHILQAADRMARLTRDLLDAASIEAGRLSLSPRAGVDLGVLVDEAIALQAPYADKKAIAMRREIVGGAMVVADRDRIAQVLANLASNAVKFTPDGGEVRVTIETLGDAVTVRVADSGPGISPDQLGRLFDRFEPGEHERSETGLGLYIARGIVEAHGAALDVATELGRGTTFSFSLRAVG